MTMEVLYEVLRERKAQDDRFGEQNHPPITWMAILTEEVGEAAQAALEGEGGIAQGPRTLEDYRAELIQVAAVAVSAVESLDRRGTK